jgi:PST family polysaccharide transporter
MGRGCPSYKNFCDCSTFIDILSTGGRFLQFIIRADLLFLSGSPLIVIMVTAIVVGMLEHDIELLCWCLIAMFHINFISLSPYVS